MSQPKKFQLCCFDTCVLIWAVQSKLPGCPAMNPELVQRTNKLVNSLKDEKATVTIPMPALSEYLTGIPEAEHADHVRAIKKGFRLAPLDEMSAIIAARIMAKKRERQQIKAQTGSSKNEVTVDCFILAIAQTLRASAVYTHNIVDFAALADGKPDIRGLPNLRDNVLFDDDAAPSE